LPSSGIEALRWMVSVRLARRGAAAIVADPVGRRPRRLDTHHRRQRFVGDLDPVDDVLGDVPVGRHHHRDRLAYVVDLVLGERVRRAALRQGRVRDELRKRFGHPGVEVVVGVDGHETVYLEGARHVDVTDTGVRVRTSHEGDCECVVCEVVEVATLAAHQPRVLDPGDALPEQLGRHGDASCAAGDCFDFATASQRTISAARSTAATMFW
jgi:hypothetical protein